MIIYLFTPPFNRRKWEWRGTWAALAAMIYFVIYYCTHRPYFAFAVTYSTIGSFMLTAWIIVAILEEFLDWKDKKSEAKK